MDRRPRLGSRHQDSRTKAAKSKRERGKLTKYKPELRYRRGSSESEKIAQLDGRRINNRTLFHFPGVSRTQQFSQVARTTFGNDGGNLFVYDVFITREVIPGAQHADRRWEPGAVLHVRKQK